MSDYEVDERWLEDWPGEFPEFLGTCARCGKEVREDRGPMCSFVEGDENEYCIECFDDMTNLVLSGKDKSRYLFD